MSNAADVLKEFTETAKICQRIQNALDSSEEFLWS